MSDLRELRVQLAKPLVGALEDDARNGLIGIEWASSRHRNNDCERIPSEIHGLRMQESVDRPGERGHVRVHDHDATARDEDA